MKARQVGKLAKMIRDIPGMQVTEGTTTAMGDLGQALLTVAMALPRNNAETLIRWIAKGVRLRDQAERVQGEIVRIKKANEEDRRLVGKLRGSSRSIRREASTCPLPASILDGSSEQAPGAKYPHSVHRRSAS